MKKKIKRIEWLNVYSKGFVVESINNNYKTEDIQIKRQNQLLSNKKDKINKYSLLNTNYVKNFYYEKISSSPKKDNKKYYYVDLNELINDSNDNIDKKENNKKQNKKEIKKEKNKNTININFINIEQNIIVKKPEVKKEIKNKKKELKNDISSPLMNYLNIQIKKSNKIFKKPLIKKKYNISKSADKNIEEINKINETENKTDIKSNNKNLNLYQFMNNKNIKKNLKKNYKENKKGFNKEKNKEMEEKGDYTFDDESMFSEIKYIDYFDELFNTSNISKNNIILGNKNKKSGLNTFLNGAIKTKDFKNRKAEEIKQIMNTIKK